MGLPAEVLKQAMTHHRNGRWEEADRLYNALLNANPFDEALLFLMGDVYLRSNRNGLGINLLSALLQMNPTHAEAWCNLGIGYRIEDRYDEAEKCWRKALDITQKDTSEVCSNMAGLYSDRCQPEQALHWVERALAVEPDMPEGHWQRGLSLLTLRDWAEGWPEYEHRLRLDHFHTRDEIDAPAWDWAPTRHLYIHGEQGIGDEVMFLSCLDEVLPLAERVTIELNHKVAPIARQTWPQVNVITEQTPGDYTAKIALGSLAARLRRSEAAFPGKPYLRPAQALVDDYRRRLEALGPGPYIALAWQGGAKRTRVADRSIPVDLLKPFAQEYTCVSAQYEGANPYIAEDRVKLGVVKLDDASTSDDMHAQAALVAAVDAVVTCQQTLVHVAGSIGAPCYVAVNSTPHWRYHMSGQMPWYDSVRLYRQQVAGEWQPVLRAIASDLHEAVRGKEKQLEVAC